MMDCLSLPDSGEYNCSNLWGISCTNINGFDFTDLWNITQKIQRYCPSDPRLWLKNASATVENAALTGRACTAIAGKTWKKYPAADIWVRVTTWKFPLLQLVASSPRPPLGVAIEGFVILHLLGDPIGTIKDLLRVISSCQQYADFWRTRLAHRDLDRRHLTISEIDHAWKSFTIITISYEEWGKGNEVKEILEQSLFEFLAREDRTPLETFLRLCNSTADALAADRSTKFLPIIVAQGFFVGGIAIAVAKITSNTSSSSFFINVEAHSIAFSALYFWILLAVFLSSVIGVSQTLNAVPRILRQFQTAFSLELPTEKIFFPNQVLESENTRAVNGGIYSWLPDRPGVYKSRQFLPLVQRNFLPILIVLAGTATAMLISGYVPPDGWQPRHCGQASILITWILSFALTCLLKRYTSSYVYNKKGRFWLTFLKDFIATVATMGGIVVTQFGIFNRCDSYTRWSRTGLALPYMPDVNASLVYRIRFVYPAIAFVSIGLQMFVIPAIIAIRYRDALLVFLHRDDENSSPIWFLRFQWPTLKRHKQQRQFATDPESPPSLVKSQDGYLFEETKQLVRGGTGHGGQ